MTRVTTACHHMLAAVQTQGGPHPGAAARVLGLVEWTLEARAHCLPHLAPQGQLPAPHKTERLEAGSLAQPALIDFALDDVLLRLLCAQAQEYNSCSVCSVKIMAYYPLD